ncbi:MAG: hypothetical protein PHN56_02970 [Candidatus Nanoarchaeia archaeon]|nr:hypothetical protein [Candidatus Nanoarchaeia archaeon]
MDELIRKYSISELEKIGNNYENLDKIKELCENYSKYFHKIHYDQTVTWVKNQSDKTLSIIEKEIETELYQYVNFMKKAIELTFPNKDKMKDLKFLIGDAIFESHDSIRIAHNYYND